MLHPVHAPHQMLHYVKLQTNPDVICLSATAEAALIEAAGAEVPGVADADRLEGYNVQLERSSLFAHDKVCRWWWWWALVARQQTVKL